MTDGGPEQPPRRRRPAPDNPAVSLASKALMVLARNRDAGSKSMSTQALADLRAAVTDSLPAACRDVIAQMRDVDRIAAEEIVDVYIPEVARQLGEEWCSDQTSFAEVTIGSARLQGVLRELMVDIPDPIREAAAPNVLVLVRANEHHTLGASVMTSQLRRLGVSVRLALGVEDYEAVSLVRHHGFDAIFVSASNSLALVDLGKFVERLRKSCGRSMPPIVVGGPVLESGADVKSVTGADVVSADIQLALRECQLRVPRSNVLMREGE